jgi:hypothetical protein
MWRSATSLDHGCLLNAVELVLTRAAKTIAEQCSVNVDLAKLKCQEG